MRPNQQKAIFLDIDGTLYAKQGLIPESAKLAIEKAKNAGHLVFINTGRNRGEIPKNIIELGIDGIIASAGAYIEYQDKIIFNEHLDDEILPPLYEYLTQQNIMFILETNDRIYGTKMNVEKQKAFFSMIAEDTKMLEMTEVFMEIMTQVEDVKQVKDVNKILIFQSAIPMDRIKEKFGSDFSVLPGSIEFMSGESGEIFGKNINKATGMSFLLEHLGIKQENTVAFGDGENDLEMLMYAGVGVAMGNGAASVKNIADFITKNASDDGIYYGFEKLELF